MSSPQMSASLPEAIPQIEAQPSSMLKLAARSLVINFKIIPTLAALAMTCFLLPFALFVTGVFLFATNKTATIILFVASAGLAIAAYCYLYGATVLAVWLHLSGIRATFVQILRRMHGKVALNVFSTGFNAGFRILGGLLLGIVPGVIAFTKYVMAIPVVVIEQRTGKAALQRSKELSAGHRGRIFGGFLLFPVLYAVTYLVAYFGVGMVFGILVLLHGGRIDKPHFQALYDFVELIMAPAGPVFLVLVYFDMRLRKEALALPPIRDIETPGGVGAAA